MKAFTLCVLLAVLASTQAVPNVVCREDGIMRFPQNCAKYIICNNRYGQVKTCQDGLHFNMNTMECDNPLTAGCEVVQEPEKDAEGGCDEQESDVLVGMCSTYMDKIHLLAYPKDCTRFVACMWGKAMVMGCTNGLHFNAALGVCDKPSNAGCDIIF